ncbi:MAG: aromatic acid exporter family protein [Hamadaea sp.]|nr:aromatic acid exporter family protein [Hamadaea sp.]
MEVELKARWARTRASFGIALQAAVAAGIAWAIAHLLLHHPQPYFAPISAIATLAVSVGQRMRRAVEIVLGNAFGILLGEALVLIIGRGALQIAFVVITAILVAVFLGGGPSLIMQSASAAVLVVAVLPTDEDYVFSRFVDAMVGGGVGLAVMALLLPLNPLTVVSRAAGPLMDELAKGLTATAAALSDRDPGRIQRALDDLRDAEQHLTGLKDAITAGREISTVAPIRWHKRGALTQYVDGYNYLARELRNARVLVRRAVSVLKDDEPAPPSLVAAVHSLADAVSWLRREYAEEMTSEASRAAATRAVRNASEAYLSGLGFSGGVIVAQIRSMATDLLLATGMEQREAERTVRRAVGRAAAVPPPPAPKRFTEA